MSGFGDMVTSVSLPGNVCTNQRGNTMNILLLIILIVVLLSILPAWPYSRGWGYYPSGGIGLVLIILLLLWLFGAI
jgi:hypothetical protein